MINIEKIGSIKVEHNKTKKQKYNGSEYLRALVEWMNSRNEDLNKNKSNLQLMSEFNKVWKLWVSLR